MSRHADPDHTPDCLESCPEAVRRSADGGLSALRSAFCEVCLQVCQHAKGRESSWHARMARLEQAAHSPIFWNPAERPDLAARAAQDFSTLTPSDVAAAARPNWAGAELTSAEPDPWAGAVVHEGPPDQVLVQPAPSAVVAAMTLLEARRNGASMPAPTPAPVPTPSAPPTVLPAATSVLLQGPPPQGPPPQGPPPQGPPPQAPLPPVPPPQAPAEFNTPAPPPGGLMLAPPTDGSAGGPGGGAGSVLLGTARGPAARDEWSLTPRQEAAERGPLLRSGKKRVVRASTGEDV